MTTDDTKAAIERVRAVLNKYAAGDWTLDGGSPSRLGLEALDLLTTTLSEQACHSTSAA